MNKTDLIAEVAKQTGLSQNGIEVIMNKMIKTIVDTLAEGQEISITGFGVFSVKNRSERQGRNPRTGEAITIPASSTASFKPAKALREALNT